MIRCNMQPSGKFAFDAGITFAASVVDTLIGFVVFVGLMLPDVAAIVKTEAFAANTTPEDLDR